MGYLKLLQLLSQKNTEENHEHVTDDRLAEISIWYVPNENPHCYLYTSLPGTALGNLRFGFVGLDCDLSQCSDMTFAPCSQLVERRKNNGTQGHISKYEISLN